jgi:hypothetical protein
MMPLDRARDRYYHDPTFRAVVDILQAIIIRLEMTPSEIREASTFACVLIEERRPMRFPVDEIDALADYQDYLQRSGK